MSRDPYYRHSVWIDVFGIVFVGVLLLGGIGYLLYHMGGAASGMSGGFSQQSRSTSPVQGHRSVHRPRSSGEIGTLSGPSVHRSSLGLDAIRGGSTVFERVADRGYPEPDGTVCLIGGNLGER